MDTLERLNAALTYIEANLDNEIDSKELSKITYYSAYRPIGFKNSLWLCRAYLYPNISAIGVWTGRLSIYRIPARKSPILPVNTVMTRPRLSIVPFRSCTALHPAKRGLKRAFS